MDSARSKGSRTLSDPRIAAIPDTHGHAKGEHRPFAEERPIAYSARMLFLWFYHACRRGAPRFLMVSDHINYLTFEDPGAVNTVRRAFKLAHAGDLYGAAEVAGVDVAHAAVVSEGLRKGMRFSIGAELDNDPRSRPDAQNIVEAMKPDGMIRSVHFLTIDHPEKGADFSWPFDNPEFASLHDAIGADKTWELYMERLLDDIEKLPGQIAGHFYVPATFGHWPTQKKLEEYEDRFVEACAARGMAIEVNTRYLYRDRPDGVREKMTSSYARLIKKAKTKGVPLAAGSDAHSPKDMSNGFDVLLQLLDDAGINELVFPVAGRLARVALRATREHLERHAGRAEPVAPGSSISGFSRAELGLPEQPELAPRSSRAIGAKKRTTGSTRTTVKPVKEKAVKAPKVPKEKPAKVVKVKPVKVVKVKPVKVVKEKLVKAPKVVTPSVAQRSRGAAKVVAATKTAAPAKKPAPVAKKPVAVVKKAAPVAKKAASATKKPVPAKKAAPIAKKAAVVGKKAAPVAKKAAPVVKKAAAPAKKVAPVGKKAAPATKKPAPAAKKPTPTKKAAPVAKKAAAPAKKAPAPAKKAAPPAKKATPPKKAGSKPAAKPKPATKRR